MALGSGHCLEGWNSVDGGIVINVSDLKSIKIDKQKMTATIGTGVVGGYVNVPDTALANWEEAYYGTHFKRLRKIKSKWDPYNVFKFEQSIPCY